MKADRRAGGKKIIGVLGGMGPEATAYFYMALIGLAAASRDQDHARVLIWSDPTVPPRTEAILEGKESPLPALLSGVGALERGGAGLIVMPCVTAHYWAPRIRSAARVPFVDLVEETAAEAKRRIAGLKTAGLVATTGTVRSGLFARALARRGVGLIVPGEKDQARIMEAIDGPNGVKAGVKTGRSRSAVVRIARLLMAEGAQAVIAGCTEIPLVLRPADLPVPLLDPMLIAASVCLRRAGYRLKPIR